MFLNILFKKREIEIHIVPVVRFEFLLCNLGKARNTGLEESYFLLPLTLYNRFLLHLLVQSISRRKTQVSVTTKNDSFYVTEIIFRFKYSFYIIKKNTIISFYDTLIFLFSLQKILKIFKN